MHLHPRPVLSYNVKTKYLAFSTIFLYSDSLFEKYRLVSDSTMLRIWPMSKKVCNNFNISTTVFAEHCHCLFYKYVIIHATSMKNIAALFLKYLSKYTATNVYNVKHIIRG